MGVVITLPIIIVCVGDGLPGITPGIIIRTGKEKTPDPLGQALSVSISIDISQAGIP